MYLRGLKDFAKSGKIEEKEIERATKKIQLLINQKIYEIFENITVYPPFCKKEEVIEKISKRLIREIEKNRETIHENIREMLEIGHPVKVLFGHLNFLLEDAEREAQAEIKNLLEYILNSKIPVDFLDDMVMAYHYVARYYNICRKIVNSMRFTAYAKYRSRGAKRFKNFMSKIFYQTATLLDNLNDLYNSLLTIKAFISIWSAEDLNSLFRKKTRWKFEKIAENKKAYHEFKRLNWELRNTIEKVKTTKVLVEYGHLYREIKSVKKETEDLWNDLLFMLT